MSKQKKLSPTELATFCSQTGWLINAGMTPADAMLLLKSDSASSQGRNIYEQIYQVCRKGDPFSDGIKACDVFPNYVIQLITLGEASGNLDVCLQTLANYYEKEDSMRQSFKSAVTYPLIMIFMMFVVIYVLISKVLPIFRQVFDALGSDMNGIAAKLLHVGETLNQYSWILLFIMLLLIVLGICFSKIGFMKKLGMCFLNWFPPTRTYLELYATQRFASGMAMTLHSGISTYESLELLAEICNNEKLRLKILNCRDELKKGTFFSKVIVESGIFTNLYSRMIGIGFKSGNIDAVMSKIADAYEKETERKIQNIISVLEPTLVIILSLIVGLILLSVILPLMGIMSSIG